MLLCILPNFPHRNLNSNKDTLCFHKFYLADQAGDSTGAVLLGVDGDCGVGNEGADRNGLGSMSQFLSVVGKVYRRAKGGSAGRRVRHY